MTGARTVTVHTLDAGLITIPEPAWCLGHDGPRDVLVDVHHSGPEHLVQYGGGTALRAELVEFPYGETPVPVSVHVELSVPDVTLDPPGLEGLATVLDEQAAELRRLALRLAVLRAGGVW
ncbi:MULTISPECIES: hypothetical protein [unclassified Streptomyces]|uniref:DUF6907 domain-containing protein n=1 Tax=unclassified Streptomyces TaxID=2593676 RepID=UPI0005F92FAC|nr:MULTISPECIES: hypothetical protein [unclassified Streptomyces]KJY18398.1 hypothetical protein VR43_25250 [Streptomyces sp. NRRL S-104]